MAVGEKHRLYNKDLYDKNSSSNIFLVPSHTAFQKANHTMSLVPEEKKNNMLKEPVNSISVIHRHVM